MAFRISIDTGDIRQRTDGRSGALQSSLIDECLYFPIHRISTPALAHRLAMMEPGAQSDMHLASELIRDLLATVAVPT